MLATSSVHTSNMMQVHLQLGGTPLLALIDSSSMHNFIAEVAASHTDLQLIPRDRLKMMMSMASRCLPSAYRGMEFVIEDEDFMGEFFALPLSAYDIVLHTHWLATLGTILSDFAIF